MEIGARRIRIEKLREHQYREKYVWPLESKSTELDGESVVEHILEQVKWVMVENARDM